MKKTRTPKERIIYDNYDVDVMYDEAKTCLMEEIETENVSDEAVWDLVSFNNSLNFETVLEELEMHFGSDKCIVFGKVGLWHGTYTAGFIADDIEKAICKAIEDCDYTKIYDVNGHLHITCSHHDGTHSFEIKKITKKGEEYYSNWENSFSTKRSEEYVHEQIAKKYSVIPRFAEKVYGCKRTEWE